jgi:hypothetical protein
MIRLKFNRTYLDIGSSYSDLKDEIYFWLMDEEIEYDFKFFENDYCMFFKNPIDEILFELIWMKDAKMLPPEKLPHIVEIQKLEYYDKAFEMHAWCLEQFGEWGINWECQLHLENIKLSKYKPSYFYFKNKEDAVLFKLIWL